MANYQKLNIVIKTTWVKPVSLFICRIKSRWLLKLISKFTVAKVYCNGKLINKLTLDEILER